MTTKVENCFQLFVICGVALFGAVLVAVSTDAQEWDTKNNNFTKVDEVIKAGLNECSNLDTDSCYGIMYTLDNICQVAYFPSCFGADQWGNFMDHLQERINSGDYPDAGYEDDQYLTLNNHHFGNDGLSK